MELQEIKQTSANSRSLGKLNSRTESGAMKKEENII